MKLGLQSKTIITLLAVLVPLVSLFSLQRVHVEQRSRTSRRIERVLTRMVANPRRVCQRAEIPRRVQKQLMHSELHVYAQGLEPLRTSNPLTPLQREQVEVLDVEEIAHFPSGIFDTAERNAPHGYTLARIDHSTCSAIMVTWPRLRRSPIRPLAHIVIPQALFLTVLLLLSGLLISVPLVRRIKRLTHDVQLASKTRSWRFAQGDTHGDDELGDLAAAFEKAGDEINLKIEELESRDLTLKEYISNTTHDLAIPLTVIQHRLRRMQRARMDGSPVELEWITGAMEESHYIASLIANMSAMAKLEAGEVHQLEHDVNMNDMVERVIARHKPIAEPKSLELVWSTPPDPVHVRGDSTLIERTLSNLVQNAIQYNDAGGHVAVILEQERDARFSLRILDDGPGVPKELLERLGERAARSDDARNRNPGGQGFGLSIVRKVCVQHAWTVVFFERGTGRF